MTMAPRPSFDICLKRVYEPAAAADGTRILVDRLWPHGVMKEKAAIDRWAREIAPSAELRCWFGHDLGRWRDFRRRYAAELSSQGEALDALAALARERRLTLVFGARDEEHNNAVVLRDLLLKRLMPRARR
jgi:uncharacterized protein YeaO (DUF488 family)